KRLSLLFICGALLPLLVLSVSHYASMHRMGSELAQSTQEILTAREKEFLQKTVNDYTRILEIKKKALETALGLQVKEMERLLARSLAAEELSKQNPVPMLSAHPDPLEERDKWSSAALAELQESYWFIQQCHPELIYRQSTSLENGLQLLSPGLNLPADGYSMQEQPWYQLAKQEGRLIWQVVQDPGGDGLIQIAAAPIFWPDGSFAGVSALHVCLENIFQTWQPPRIWEEQAQAALVLWQEDGSSEGKLRVMAYKRFQRHSSMVRGQPGEQERYLDLEQRDSLQPLLQKLAQGYPGVSNVRLQDREMLFAYGRHKPGEPFPMLMLPKERIFAQAQLVQDQVGKKTRKWLKLTIGSLVGALVLSTLLALFSARTVIRPVMKLARTANALANGDFSSRVSISSGDELQELGRTFNDMSWRLQENERMRHAMAVARETQQYLLPKQAPGIKNYDIAGRSLYSDETGGDYYDFIELENAGQEKLGIAVGDVSGHGLGVALLMASARGVIRSHAARFSSDLGNLFEMLNEHLIRDTGDGRFLTLFYGLLDAGNNTLTWSSAGHEPGLWLQRKSGQIVELPSTGMPLGISRQAKHAQAGPIQLQTGDIVLLGTDGIRETRNQDREMFGRERVEAILRSQAHKSTREILASIVQSLEEFRGQTSQEDDVTLVAIKLQPQGEQNELDG
ncbi:MAG: SpoIIE family protein phosphatase, partial [Thermodesulfobacteriota bacterium]